MKQTAMQQHIAWLLKHQLTLDIPMEVIEDAEYRLEVEQQQIIDTYVAQMDCTDIQLMKDTIGKQYYNETYQK